MKRRSEPAYSYSWRRLVTVVAGDLLGLDVESVTPGIFIPVSDMSRYASQTAQERILYGRFQFAPKATYGQYTKSLSLSGLLNDGDTGQQRLRDALATKTQIKVRVYPDGANGYEATVRVLSMSHSASAEAGTIQEGSFECEVVGVPTLIGTGHVV